jgi:hypothetical protein
MKIYEKQIDDNFNVSGLFTAKKNMFRAEEKLPSHCGATRTNSWLSPKKLESKLES